MHSRTTMRAAVLVATFFSLVLGGAAASAPPASAEGEVTVTWPEITAFDADETDYVIDVVWDGTGSLWLRALGEFRTYYDEITSPGAMAVAFPVHDQSGWRKFTVLRCTAEGLDHRCIDVAESPLLDVTRSPVGPVVPSRVSVDWPEVDGFNPDTSSYVPGIEWDGEGSLFLLHRYGDGDFTRYDEIHEPGPYAVDLPVEGAGDTWDIELAWCPGAVLELEYCDELGQRLDIAVWRSLALDFGVTAARTWGPNTAFRVEVAPLVDESVEATWRVVDDQGSVVADGTSSFRAGESLPALGALPQLVDDHQYEVMVSATADTSTFGRLTGSASVPIRWDSQNRSVLTAGACCGFVESEDFYPEPDGYLDSFEFRSPRSDESVAMEVVIRNPMGVAVFEEESAHFSDGRRVTWDGRDRTGAIVPEGEYAAEVSITDIAGNTATHRRSVRVSRKMIVRKIWRGQVGIDDSRFARDRVGCGRLVRPARAEWPGSVGYYTPDGCPANADYSIGTRHRLELPTSFTGEYGSSRITVVGGKSRLEKRSRLTVEYFGGTDPAQVTDRAGMDGNTGPHVGPWGATRPRTFGDTEGLFLTWGVRAGQGSRYDVRRFIVEVEYDVLE